MVENMIRVVEMLGENRWCINHFKERTIFNRDKNEYINYRRLKMSCNNARFNEEGRYNCRVSGDECIYLIPNKERCYKDGYINIEIEIIKSNDYEWYKDCIGRKFTVQSESKKGGKDKYVVRLNKEDRHLMNGYNYGWVLKEHCKII